MQELFIGKVPTKITNGNEKNNTKGRCKDALVKKLQKKKSGLVRDEDGLG